MPLLDNATSRQSSKIPSHYCKRYNASATCILILSAIARLWKYKCNSHTWLHYPKKDTSRFVYQRRPISWHSIPESHGLFLSSKTKKQYILYMPFSQVPGDDTSLPFVFKNSAVQDLGECQTTVQLKPRWRHVFLRELAMDSLRRPITLLAPHSFWHGRDLFIPTILGYRLGV